MTIISVVVLLFQALLLAHGGLTTLGANTLSMGIVGPFVAYFIYKLLKKKNVSFAIFFRMCSRKFSNLYSYINTISFSLSIKCRRSISICGKVYGCIAITQIPLAIVEGIISVVIYDFIKKHCREELVQLEGGLL